MAAKLWFFPSSHTWVLGQWAHEAAREGHSEERQLTEPSPFARCWARLDVLSFNLHTVPMRLSQEWCGQRRKWRHREVGTPCRVTQLAGGSQDSTPGFPESRAHGASCVAPASSSWA